MEIDITDGRLDTDEGVVQVKILTASSSDMMVTRLVLPVGRGRELAAFLLADPPPDPPALNEPTEAAEPVNEAEDES